VLQRWMVERGLKLLVVRMERFVYRSRSIRRFVVRSPVLYPLKLDEVTTELLAQVRKSGHLPKIVGLNEEVCEETVDVPKCSQIGNEIEVSQQ
jgi:cystathionine beta-lyase/cystathionine gamma-synthase